MKRKLVLTGLSFLLIALTEAQIYYYPSPVSNSLGLSGAGDTTVWSVFTNPSGISSVSSTIVGGGYHNSFGIPALSAKSVFAVVPSRMINSGAGYSHYGNDLFNVQQAFLAFARALSPDLHMGCRFDYIYRYIHGVPAQGVFLIDAGFRYSISENVLLAVMAENSGQTEITDEDINHPLPASLAVSCGVRLSPSFFLTADIAHRADLSSQIYALGLSARVHNLVEFRGALSAKPVKLAIGTALRWYGVEMNISASHHDHLGMSFTTGIAYYFGQQEGGGF